MRAARSEGARGHWWAEDIVAAPRRFPLGSSLLLRSCIRHEIGQGGSKKIALPPRGTPTTRRPSGSSSRRLVGLVVPLVCLFLDSWAGGAPRLTSGGWPAQFLMFSLSLSRIFEETEIVIRFFCSNGN